MQFEMLFEKIKEQDFKIKNNNRLKRIGVM